jgi:hypothetical protein
MNRIMSMIALAFELCGTLSQIRGRSPTTRDGEYTFTLLTHNGPTNRLSPIDSSLSDDVRSKFV